MICHCCLTLCHCGKPAAKLFRCCKDTKQYVLQLQLSRLPHALLLPSSSILRQVLTNIAIVLSAVCLVLLLCSP
jgi:hypothetical protein